MVRIRPGRSWRVNPGYVGQLRSLSEAQSRRFDASAVLDVVGIEVDGVDIAAGIGEAQVLLAVAELAEALVRLGAGEPAAQATIGPGPTEALLEARGSDVLLSLVRLGRPARVLAGGLLVDGAKLRAAALQAAEGLLGDLLDLNPALRAAAVGKRLQRAAQRLRGKAQRARAWPERPSAAQEVRSLVLRSGRGPLRCEVQVPLEAAERLSSPIDGAPLASLLARGSLALRAPDAPAVSLEAPLYLALRDAVHAADALVHAWEAGERDFELQLGPAHLRFDLARGELRAEGFTRPARASAPEVAAALASAARTFAARALRLAGDSAGVVEPLRDLRAAAGELLRHCRDLASGELRRAPDAVVAEPLPRPAAHSSQPLHRAGRVRKLVFREALRIPLQAAPLQLLPFERALWAALPDSLRGFDLESGRALGSLECGGPRAVARAPGGVDLFVCGGGALVRLDAASGHQRWRRKMAEASAEPPALFALGPSVLVAQGGQLSLVAGGGQVVWRARLEAPPAAAMLHEGALALVMPGATLAVLEAQSGRALFRKRLLARSGVPALIGGLVVLAEERAPGELRLSALEASSGEPAWDAPLMQPTAGQLPAPIAAGEDVAISCGGRLHCLRASDGASRFAARLPWGSAAEICAADELDDGPRQKRSLRGPLLAAAGPGGALALYDGAGVRAWSAEGDGKCAPQRPQIARGVIAAATGAGVVLRDLFEGIAVGKLGARAPVSFAVGADLSIAVFDGDELVAHRLSTHLSVV